MCFLLFRLAAVKLATLFVSWQTALSGDIALFTPKEVLALIAALVDLTPSVRFNHHGPSRAKFVEVHHLYHLQCRLAIVTGEHSSVCLLGTGVYGHHLLLIEPVLPDHGDARLVDPGAHVL